MNKTENVMNLFKEMARKGPAMFGERYDEVAGMNLQVVTFTVSNRSVVPDDIPFGIMVEIQPQNSNWSQVVAKVHPRTGIDEPVVFSDKLTWVKNYSEYICMALVVTKVVAPGTRPDTAPWVETVDEEELSYPVWESKVEPIDEKHSLKTTVYIVDLAQQDESSEWVDELNQSVTYRRYLSNSFVASGVVVTGTPPSSSVKYTYSRPVQCGWWLVIEETFNPTIAGFTTVQDYGWPPVLDGVVLIKQWVTRAGAIRYYPNIIWKRDAYNGPCKVTVARSWSATAPTVEKPVAMIPTAVHYNCPFFQFTTGPCLHIAQTIAADIADLDDPDWEQNVSSSSSFAATNYTDWAETLVIDDDVQPYKGGYLRQTVTVYRPI